MTSQPLLRMPHSLSRQLAVWNPLHPPPHAAATVMYLPSPGVMPLIFASSLLGLPLALARLTDSAALEGAASALGPGGALYLPVNVALIAFFNYYYTFLQVSVCMCGG